MAIKYPTILYRCPGPHFGPNGSTYEIAQARDDDQFDELLDKGYSQSLTAAVDRSNEPEPEPDSVDKSIDGLSRAELEEKAKALGIRFQKRTLDIVLATRIAEAIKGL